jgi:hypothetical protein
MQTGVLGECTANPNAGIPCFTTKAGSHSGTEATLRQSSCIPLIQETSCVNVRNANRYTSTPCSGGFEFAIPRVDPPQTHALLQACFRAVA